MDSTPTAIVFPGQGSQASGMREQVERYRPGLLELAECEVPGLFERVEESTRFAQPAIYCAGLAGFAKLEALEADCYAGHSLGEIGALVAASALAEEDGLRLVALRGRLMDEAGRADSGGGMLALLGEAEAAGPAPADIAAEHGLAVANDNASDQVVLSGTGAALDRAALAAEAAGLRAMRLPVSGAFHSPAMGSAVPEFTSALEDTHFSAPAVPVLSGVSAAPFDHDVRRRLAESLTHPVRWREVLLALHGRGVRRLVETGPGRVLSRLTRRSFDDVEAVTADRLEPARAA